MSTRRDLSSLTADVASLQQADGSFAGDSWGEVDTRCGAGCWWFAACQLVSMLLMLFRLLIRGLPLGKGLCRVLSCDSAPHARRFSYCALSCCALLGRLDALDVQRAAQYVAACRNFDGAFGRTPGALVKAPDGVRAGPNR